MGPIWLPGGSTYTRSVTPGRPLASSRLTRASPTASSWMAAPMSPMRGLGRMVSPAALTAFWSRGVNARSACCTRLPSCASTVSGTSNGFCVTKYTPTPLLRTSRTTSSMRSTSAAGASLNSRCASSKKNTSLGLSRSPTSGSVSNSSLSIHSRKVAYSRGAFISLSAARMLMTPWPPTVCMKSAMSSMGSPKKRLPPCSSICSRPRWMAPTLAALMLPYSVVNCFALSPTCCSMARRSFMSSSAMPASSAILNTRLSTPACVSFSASMRASSSGPMSETVARTGWPCAPNTSQSVVGQAKGSVSGRPRSARMAFTLGGSAPRWLMPVRSPFTSAMNTGTPMRLKLSASVCSVIVLPVPVAPVMRPWRLARAGSRWHSTSPWRASRMGSGISRLQRGGDAARRRAV